MKRFLCALLVGSVALGAASCSKKDDAAQPAKPSPEDSPAEQPADQGDRAASPGAAATAAPRPAESGGEAEGAPADGRARGRDPDKLVAKFDKNGDGALEESEVPDWMRALVQRADANHDGKVTADELRVDRAAHERGDRKRRKHGAE